MANLSSFDLNLLRVLDALLIERSTVKAGARLGLSQPAVSGALKRLRLSLGDELFFRSGQKLEATEFALSLKEPLRNILGGVEALIGPRDAFDPATAEHSFRISGSDFFAEMLMPALAEYLAAHAPSLRVHLVNLVPDDGVETMASHDLDFVLLPETRLPDWAEGEPVFSSSFSVIARKAHPRTSELGLASDDVMPLDLFCDLGHVLFSTGGHPNGLGDEALARIGRERRVAMTLPVFSGVYRAVASSDFIALLPTPLAHRVAKSANLNVFEPPIHMDLVRLVLIWPRRLSESPPHLWLRNRIIELLRPVNACATGLILPSELANCATPR
ncbi:LysR family transcriptional regulator [Marinovum sp. KMM 9879]